MTELARKKFLFLALLICAALIIFGLYFKASTHSNILRLNDKSFSTETVADDASRAKGLSGRDQIDDDHAMIFIFDQSGERCFWMKDMKFSIDIVWLDTTNRVSAVENNVSPNTYPQNFCHSGKRVIEFSAGAADRINLKVGDQARL